MAESSLRLQIRPIRQRECHDFIRQHHRHHKPPVSEILRASAWWGNKMCGVITAGRPVARHLDDGLTLEVTRCCTDGTKNACTKLYSSITRAAKALGYQRVITYTLDSEPGTSLKAAGWRVNGSVTARSWHTPSRPRQTDLIQGKTRWEFQGCG